jgi:hypothetical protein
MSDETEIEITGIDIHGHVTCEVPGICFIDDPHPAKYLMRLHCDCQQESWTEKWCSRAWKTWKHGAGHNNTEILCPHGAECSHKTGALHIWKVTRL